MVTRRALSWQGWRVVRIPGASEVGSGPPANTPHRRQTSHYGFAADHLSVSPDSKPSANSVVTHAYS